MVTIPLLSASRLENLRDSTEKPCKCPTLAAGLQKKSHERLSWIKKLQHRSNANKKHINTAHRPTNG
jgi:hypothetical protein